MREAKRWKRHLVVGDVVRSRIKRGLDMDLSGVVVSVWPEARPHSGYQNGFSNDVGVRDSRFGGIDCFPETRFILVRPAPGSPERGNVREVTV